MGGSSSTVGGGAGAAAADKRFETELALKGPNPQKRSLV